jgi:hypothetical protein
LNGQPANVPCELRRSFVVPIRSGLLRMTCLGCAPSLCNCNFRLRPYSSQDFHFGTPESLRVYTTRPAFFQLAVR